MFRENNRLCKAHDQENIENKPIGYVKKGPTNEKFKWPTKDIGAECFQIYESFALSNAKTVQCRNALMF